MQYGMNRSRKISARVNTPNGSSVRVYFEEQPDRQMVYVWSRGMNRGAHLTSRYGTRLSRDWVRAFCAYYNMTATF